MGKCSGSMPSAQGAVCCKDAAKCNEFTKTAIESFGGAVAKFLSEDWKGGVEETTKFASNLALSKCGQVKGTEDATDRPVDTDKEQSEKEADQSEKEAEDQELLQRMLKDKDCSCSGICGPCPDCHACHSCLQYGAHCDRILKSEQEEGEELLQRMLKDKDCSCSGICGPCPDCHACHSCLQYGAHCDRIL